MSDFFSRLVERSQGSARVLQPLVAPRYASPTQALPEAADTFAGADDPGSHEVPQGPSPDAPPGAEGAHDWMASSSSAASMTDEAGAGDRRRPRGVRPRRSPSDDFLPAPSDDAGFAADDRAGDRDRRSQNAADGQAAADADLAREPAANVGTPNVLAPVIDVGSSAPRGPAPPPEQALAGRRELAPAPAAETTVLRPGAAASVPAADAPGASDENAVWEAFFGKPVATAALAGRDASPGDGALASSARGRDAFNEAPPAPLAPSFEVTIGRIEVRASSAPSRPVERARRGPRMTLQDYIHRQGHGRTR